MGQHYHSKELPMQLPSIAQGKIMFMGILDPALCYPQYLHLNRHNHSKFWSLLLVNGLFIQNSKELPSETLQKPFYKQKLRLSSNLAHKEMANPQKTHFKSKGQGFSR